MFIKFIIKIVIIMGLIVIVAIITPVLAKIVDKIFHKKSITENPPKPEDYKVKDIYEGDKNNENN